MERRCRSFTIIQDLERNEGQQRKNAKSVLACWQLEHHCCQGRQLGTHCPFSTGDVSRDQAGVEMTKRKGFVNKATEIIILLSLLDHPIHRHIWHWHPGLFCGRVSFSSVLQLQKFQVQSPHLFSFDISGWNVRTFICYSSSCQISFMFPCGSSLALAYLSFGVATELCTVFWRWPLLFLLQCPA